ncbi:hypothetical protein JCM19000A_14140 [Silvimonas sp. JCM 19000]
MSEPHKDNRHAADQIPSNQHNKSNFESNYPDGAADSTGQDKRSQRDASQLHGKEIGKPTPHHDDQYGPAPPRDQIRPPELDPAAQNSPAAGESIPASVSKRSDGEEYARHFGEGNTGDAGANPNARGGNTRH